MEDGVNMARWNNICVGNMISCSASLPKDVFEGLMLRYCGDVAEGMES